ncbi:hypothetical protein [Rhizobium sp. BK650]|uniref:hypothetical protein n=1 Tax=Rhizobium sp. BK650 TaxID=2586990 RepID=UPI001FEE01D4|nr:hypothetical protein [Rhizobium sp. BK650]
MHTSKKTSDRSDVKKDAEGQFASSQADGKASGVASAKPTAITGSEDATVHKTPPAAKPVMGRDVNFRPSSSNKGRKR